MSWNAIYEDDKLILLNGEDTVIRRSKNVSEETVVEILSRIEDFDVPIAYTAGLKEIYFTSLRGQLEGYYDVDAEKIVVSCSRKHVSDAHMALIHEIGHHVDCREALSEMDEIVSEWLRLSGALEEYHVDMKKKDNGVEEYVAAGFEMYYMGKYMDEHDVLRSCIDTLHSSSK